MITYIVNLKLQFLLIHLIKVVQIKIIECKILHIVSCIYTPIIGDNIFYLFPT
jgi:hypothetical protein